MNLGFHMRTYQLGMTDGLNSIATINLVSWEANFSEWDDSLGGYEIQSIVKGDPWSSQNSGSLYRASADIQVGDVLGAIQPSSFNTEKTPECFYTKPLAARSSPFRF